MSYEVYEGLGNVGHLLIRLSEAAHPKSEGGAKIEMGELLPILADFGLEVIGDITDDEPEATETE